MSTNESSILSDDVKSKNDLSENEMSKNYLSKNEMSENNLTENVEQSVETFDNSDGVILEQARRRQRIKEVTIWSSKY